MPDKAAENTAQPDEIAQWRWHVEVKLRDSHVDQLGLVAGCALPKAGEWIASVGRKYVHDVRRHEQDDECGYETAG